MFFDKQRIKIRKYKIIKICFTIKASGSLYLLIIRSNGFYRSSVVIFVYFAKWGPPPPPSFFCLFAETDVDNFLFVSTVYGWMRRYKPIYQEVYYSKDQRS